MRRLAKSALEERGSSAASPGLQAAPKKSLDHAERDLLRLFRSLGMSVDIPISQYVFGLSCVPHLKVRAWWEYLLKFRSPLLFGGFTRREQEAELAMKCFWENLKGSMGEHNVYSTHRDRLECCLPFYLFLDEGTSLRKSAVLVMSMQPVLGSSTASKFNAALQQDRKRKRDPDPEVVKQIMSDCQAHNAKGITYNSRFLYTVLPKKVYKKNDRLDKVLNKLANECIDVMSNGVAIGSKTYYPVCLGVKGDAPMLMRLGNFTRGFSHMGRNKGCCFECQAGVDGHHFEDVRLAPDWEPSPLYCQTLHGAIPLTADSGPACAR